MAHARRGRFRELLFKILDLRSIELVQPVDSNANEVLVFDQFNPLSSFADDVSQIGKHMKPGKFKNSQMAIATP